MRYLNLTNKNLKIIPEEVSESNERAILANSNQLTTLYNLPKNVMGYIWCYKNNLFSLDFLSLTFYQVTSTYFADEPL